MIVSSFFSANLRKVLNWVTDANLGNQTSSSFNIPLQASRPCTFTLVSVSPSDVNVSLSGNVVYISNNPRNNVTYSITVRATAGLISTNRTFTFVAYNNPPTWVTPTSVTFGKTSTVSYQLQTTDSDTSNITFTITSGALHPGISMSSTGLITGNTLYNNATKTVTIVASDGITSVPRTISFTMPPYQRTLQFPQASTITSNYTSGRGPISIDNTWLNTAGFVNVLTDLTVVHGTIRTYSNGGYSSDGLGSGSPPTITIYLSSSYIASLYVSISGYVCGPWGRRGENHQNDASYYYPGNSNTGTSGGTGVAIYTPCTFVAAGNVFGGGGGGGSGGAGLDAWAPSSGGRGGNGGTAFIIYCAGVTIINNNAIGGGGGGGGGGWGSSINGTSDGGSGYDANSSTGYGGNGGYGTGSGSTSGGAGGGPGANGANGGTHSSGSYAPGGTAGMAIYSPYGYTYTLSPVGTIYGTRS